MTVVNPGADPVPHATREHAVQNIAVFAEDLADIGLPVSSTAEIPARD